MIKIKGYALAYQAGEPASKQTRAVRPESRENYKVIQKDAGRHTLAATAVATLTARQKVAIATNLPKLRLLLMAGRLRLP
jgi:hypothetical protein